MEDYTTAQCRDYVITGDTQYHEDEMKIWGAMYNLNEKQWIVYDTEPSCPDYQALVEMGLDLRPIQISAEAKLLDSQLLGVH